MKSVIWTKYGPPDALQLRDIEIPTPKDGEVLIRIQATTVTAGDCELRSLKSPLWTRLPLRFYFGVSKPTSVKILGQELAGVIEMVGSGVTRFKAGDPVFGPAFFHLGAYAEYVCLPEKYLVLKPPSLTYEQAATIPVGGINGAHLVREANVQSGGKLLINGAGGSIGTYALQIAKLNGAEVTCVDSAGKLDMLRSIGADHVIDYTQEDFTRNGETYDAIIDVVGKSPYSGSLRSLKPGGRYVLGNPSLPAMIRSRWTSERKVITAPATNRAEDYAYLIELIAAGKIKTIVDRRYPLEETAEAHRYVDSGQKKGNVIITVVPDSS